MRLIKSFASVILAASTIILSTGSANSSLIKLASFEQGTITTSHANTVIGGVTLEIGYESSTSGIFDGPVFATSFFNFSGQTTTNSGAGFALLQQRIIDGVDDTVLYSTTLTTQGGDVTIRNQTFTESTWISGGDTSLTGSDLTGFDLSELVLTVSPFSFRQSGTTSTLSIGLKYELFGTPNVTPIPEPATLGLFGFGLVGLGLAARRRKTA